jgi:hypothetical protein
MAMEGRASAYAPSLGHVLNLLEGHYLTGFGDRSVPVTQFAPINPLPGSVESAEEALRTDSADRQRIDALLALVDGFETPYSLELLATVHFAATHHPATADPAALIDRVSSWSLRKARLFTDRHVRLAAERLAEHRLLPTPLG